MSSVYDMVIRKRSISSKTTIESILHLTFIKRNNEVQATNRPFSYPIKESGSSDIFIHFYSKDFRLNDVTASIPIVQIRKFYIMYQKHRSIQILF